MVSNWEKITATFFGRRESADAMTNDEGIVLLLFPRRWTLQMQVRSQQKM